MRETLLTVFISWVQISFQNKSAEEIKKMLGINTPLEETRPYKEFVSIGRDEGKIEGKIVLK